MNFLLNKQEKELILEKGKQVKKYRLPLNKDTYTYYIIQQNVKFTFWVNIP